MDSQLKKWAVQARSLGLAALLVLALALAVGGLAWITVPLIYLLMFLLKIDPDATGGIVVVLAPALVNITTLALFVRVIAMLGVRGGRDMRPLRLAVIAFPVLCALALVTPEALVSWATPLGVFLAPASVIIALATIGAFASKEATPPAQAGPYRTTLIDIPRGPA
ncbi:hypothetical protein EG835_07385 [bacterium]|nr:hypothetical protein [bacterium]